MGKNTENENGGLFPVLKKISDVVFLLGLAGGATEMGRRKVFEKGEKRRRERVRQWMRAVKRRPVDGNSSGSSYEKVMPEDMDMQRFSVEHLSDEEQAFWKSKFSTVTGGGAYAAMTLASFDALLKCNLPISELANVKDKVGMLRAVVVDDKGRIRKHAQFSQAGVMQATPLLVYQYLAAVTSRQYMHEIVVRLDRIQQTLDLIIANDNAAKKGELQSILSGLDVLWKKDCYEMADVIGIDRMLQQAEKLRNEFMNRVEDFDILSKDFEKRTHHGCAGEFVQKYRKSNFALNVQLAAMAEVLVYLATLTRARVAYCLGNDEECTIYLDKLSVENWAQLTYWVERAKVCMLKYLEFEKQDSLMNAGQIDQLIISVKTDFVGFEKHIAQFRKVLDQTVPVYFRLLENGELVRLSVTA